MYFFVPPKFKQKRVPHEKNSFDKKYDCEIPHLNTYLLPNFRKIKNDVPHQFFKSCPFCVKLY